MNEQNTKRLTIREWAEDDRPREKLLAKGVQSLSNAELLAILIGSGNAEETAVELMRRVLHDAGDNLNELARLSVAALCKQYKGIGTARAISIVAALELANRRKINDLQERRSVQFSRDIYELLLPYVADLRHEELWMVLVDKKMKLIEIKQLSKGGTNTTTVDVPMLLRFALEKSADGIAVAHNHPSDDTVPSAHDIKMGKSVKEACQAIKLRFIDSLIISRTGYYSCMDNGAL
jgi:DNA repair protein RadC